MNPQEMPIFTLRLKVRLANSIPSHPAFFSGTYRGVRTSVANPSNNSAKSAGLFGMLDIFM